MWYSESRKEGTLTQNVGLDVGVSSGLLTEQQKYWNKALTKSDDNPYPLAPADLVEQGMVTPESYEEATNHFSLVWNKHMCNEINALVQEPGFKNYPKIVEVFGAGFLRDLKEWLLLLSQVGMNFAITDLSDIACNNCYSFIDTYALSSRSEVRETDVEEAWKSGWIVDEETLFIYAGQFVQNQKTQAKNRILKCIGHWLALRSCEGALFRRFYLLHPLGEENPPELVRWKNTKPYTLNELQKPIEQGFGGPVAFEVVGKDRYFDHQAYTLFRIRGLE